MYKFPLPFYNITGCNLELHEEWLIEWLTERSDEEIQSTRSVNVFHPDGIATIYQSDPQLEDYWNLNVAGHIGLINTVGCNTWHHKRNSMFMVDENKRFHELLDTSETYFEISDEYLALQFKLIL
jgi:hypothetical protein